MSARQGYSKAFATNYKEIDWSDFKPAVTAKVDDTGRGSGPWVMPDITPFVSPIERREITSRSALREHNQRHGVFQVGNDLKPEDYAQKPETKVNETALSAAFRIALEKTGL